MVQIISPLMRLTERKNEMLIQVENKIKELKELKSKEYYKQKDLDLENWGIAREGKGKKAPPVAITDEEYEALIKISNGVGKTGRNKVAITMSKASVASLIICIIAGIVSFVVASSKGFVWMSLWIMAGFAFMGIFKGLSEAIRLLQQILDGGKDGIPEKTEDAPAAPAKAAFIPVQQAPYPYPPQPFYAPAPPISTVSVPNVTPVASRAPVAPAPAPAAPAEPQKNGYESMPSYDFNPQEDFFTKPYEPQSYPKA